MLDLQERDDAPEPASVVAGDEADVRCLVATGRLTWDKGERVTDRYGIVTLYCPSGNTQIEPDETHAGKHGRLIAIVRETARSGHLGDWARGIFPSTPNVGDEISLGIGTLVFETTYDEGRGVGLEPDDGRYSDWLNPNALYRCHSQVVDLYFEPTN